MPAILSQLKSIWKSPRKQGFFWHCLIHFDVFWSLCIMGEMLAQKENSFICEKKWLGPLGVHQLWKEFFWAQTATVLRCGLLFVSCSMFGGLSHYCLRLQIKSISKLSPWPIQSVPLTLFMYFEYFVYSLMIAWTAISDRHTNLCKHLISQVF